MFVTAAAAAMKLPAEMGSNELKVAAQREAEKKRDVIKDGRTWFLHLRGRPVRQMAGSTSLSLSNRELIDSCR